VGSCGAGSRASLSTSFGDNHDMISRGAQFGSGTWLLGGLAALAVAFVVLGSLTGTAPVSPPLPVRDHVCELQCAAEREGRASWCYWGDQPEKYVSWSNHSNRLIPIYAFGMAVDAVSGSNSVYRDATRLETLFGRLPDRTLTPDAPYFDQTDVFRLQRAAADAGAKRIILFVFDGMDWHTTRAAAIQACGRVGYSEGRGTGLSFQDYRGAPTDYGWFVTSPANDGTKVDVDAQVLRNPGGDKPGGYDPTLGGPTPWYPRASMRYLMGRDRDVPHAVTDSAASATSLCTGRKTYNDSINVGPAGEELVPIARLLQAEGWAVGAVTSVALSHATPACSYANNVSRDDYQDIARDMVGQPSIFHRTTPLPGLDVVIGAGWGVDSKAEKEKDQGQNFEPGNKYVADSTLAAIDVEAGGRYRLALRTPGRPGAEVLTAAARIAQERGERFFGFFGAPQGHLPFATANGDFDPCALPPDAGEEVDRLRKKYGGTIRYTDADLVENPTLADMAVAALDVLESRGRFWLMIEAGDVDWGSHANNIDTTIGAIKSGAAAFTGVARWIEAHGGWDDTVVLVTSDHGHAFVLTDPAALAGSSR